MKVDDLKFTFETLPSHTNNRQSNFLSDEDRFKILNVFNNPVQEDTLNKTLIDIFLEQVNKKPNSTAVVFKEQKLTYTELDVLSNQLAHYLISKHHIRVGDLVGLFLEKSEKVIVCILGVLKAGAAYVPVDPEYPEQRINYIKNDSKCKVTIDSKVYDDFYNNRQLLSERQPENVSLRPSDLCYIIYTSGTTGNPKGVMIEHRGVVNLIVCDQKIYKVTDDENILLFANYCFDASVETIFLALLTGCKLSIISTEDIRNHLLLPFLQHNKITHLDITPSYLETLEDISHLKHLKRIVVGGEVCSLKLANTIAADFNFYNGYGPTENSIACIINKYSAENRMSDSFPIGKPIDNTGAYILSDSLELKGIGEVGELCLSGVGLSRGYLNLPELTSQKFINHPFKENSKLYKTGDLAKWLPNGNIEYIGRKDNQVKIRGYRIELEEVESQLLTIDNIKVAVVLVEDDRLIAYILLNQNVQVDTDTINEWKKQLLNSLPVYFIPYKFKIIEKIPFTSNGKLDKKALLEQEYLSTTSSTIATKPRTETEQLVADIWQEALKIDEIDIFSNFFELGGHSLIAVKIINKIEQTTTKKLPLSSLFKYSTVEKLAKQLTIDQISYPNCLVPLKTGGKKPPIYIVHGSGLNVFNFIGLSKYFDDDQPIFGIQGNGPQGLGNWYQSIEEMASHYVEEILKTNPNGPYAIAGFSFGGIVAFEMARQLKEKGKGISFIGLLDTYLEPAYYYKKSWQKSLISFAGTTHRRLNFLIEMVTSWKGLKLRFKIKKEHILKRYFGKKNIVGVENELFEKEYAKANVRVDEIRQRFQVKPQNFQVDLFRAAEDTEYKIDPNLLGWSRAALKGVTVHNIPSNHIGIIAPPNDKILARMIQEILNHRNKSNVSKFFFFAYLGIRSCIGTYVNYNCLHHL